MSRKLGPAIVLLVVIVLLLRSAFFMVDETKQAIVVQLGKPVSGVKGPGLHFKIPFIQDVIEFERRLLDYDASPAEILTADKKTLVVDNYAKWKVIDPLLFYQRVRNVRGAQSRLDDIIFAELRVELGRHLMAEIINTRRSEIMEAVTKRSDSQAKAYGISVADVRIKRADLPQENERAVFGRMKAEREREAKRYRSEGQEAALRLRAEADRERTVILAEAYRQAETLRGQGEAEATRIYAEAFGYDPEFYAFLRSLESYRKSMDEKTTLVLSPNDEFLKFMKESGVTLEPPLVEKEIIMPEPAASMEEDVKPPVPEKPAE
jgi:membrane protease subunit HflC